MNWLAYARHDCVDRPPEGGEAALLLEGSWSGEAPSEALWALDDAIDGRLSWIDEEAAAVCRRIAQPGSQAWLNAPALQYYLVKLIRPIAFFRRVRPLGPGDSVELVAEQGRDNDYAEALAQLARRAGAAFSLRWAALARASGECAFPPNGRMRRVGAWLNRRLAPRIRLDARPRVVLCGNPRLLDPVCEELLRRNCRVWWLYDRFAFRSWLRWRVRGAGQLTCESDFGDAPVCTPDYPERIACCGVDLAEPVRRWLWQNHSAHGPRQVRMLRRIDGHFRRLRPDALVLDEDATPFSRAAVTVARRFGATSFVVQHGVPCCRFGYAPLAADRFLAWGQSSVDQLARWGVSREQMIVTGSPTHDRLRSRLPGRRCGTADGGWRSCHPDGVPRILLVLTAPPRDDRPDAVALNLTGRTWRQMLRLAFAGVARLGRTRFWVKPHPRALDDPVLAEIRAQFAELPHAIVRRRPLERWLARVDCVLSCGSSAGVDAARAGLPVIQLLPPHCRDFIPHDQWGLIGTAGSDEQIDALLRHVLCGGWKPPAEPDPHVFGPQHGSAAARVADAILPPPIVQERLPLPEPAAASLGPLPGDRTLPASSTMTEP